MASLLEVRFVTCNYDDTLSSTTGSRRTDDSKTERLYNAETIQCSETLAVALSSGLARSLQGGVEGTGLS